MGMRQPAASDGSGLLDLCVVVLNYNGGTLLQEAVRAALASADLRVDVVVVDNGSTDGSVDALEQRAAAAGSWPAAGTLLLLRVGANLGFATGNNLGLFALPARYIVLLNNDAVVEAETLGILARFMDGHPRAGACAPRLLWPDGQPQPFSHGGDPTPAYLVARARARRLGRTLHEWGGDEPRAVDWVAGTCMVLRPAALSEVGPLDSSIFMYFEDNDLCRRLRGRGWQVYFVPEAAVRHYNRPSYADRARLRNYYRGLARFYRKHYGMAPGLAMRVLGLAQLWRHRCSGRASVL
jgi:GT2 family glycosyltransferase